MIDPEYVDDPFENDWRPRHIPDWSKPINDIEELILAAVDRKYFETRKERDLIRKISTNTRSLLDKESDFPNEWIKKCCTWAKKKREKGELVQLKGLISFIYNEERRDEFVKQWIENNRRR